MKKSLKMLGLGLGVLASLMFSQAAFAESVNITGGTLTVTQTALTLSGVTLDLTQNQSSTGSSTISVKDFRGSGAGWGVTLAITDFMSGSLTDPSAPATSTLTASIAASNVGVVTSGLTAVAGQAIHGTYGPKANTITLSNSAQTILNASPGYGMGSYDATAAFTLTIPKLVKVASTGGTGSKYTVNGNIGILAGTYTSTFTYSTIAGI